LAILKHKTYYEMDYSPDCSWNGVTVGQTVAGPFLVSSLGFTRIFYHLTSKLTLVLAVSG